VRRVTLELSPDGVTYTPLGAGTRIAGGWRLSGLALPFEQNLFIRARGYYTTGYENGSGSVVESVRNAYLTRRRVYLPLVLRQYEQRNRPTLRGAAPTAAFRTITLRPRGCERFR